MELDQVRRERDTAAKPAATVETAEADGALTGGGSCHLRYQGEDGWHCLFAGKGLLQLMGCEQRELVGVLSACVLTPEGEQGSCTGGEILSRLAKRPQEISHGGRVRQPDGRVRRIGGSFTSVRGEEGVMEAYGHIVDLGGLYEESARYRALNEQFVSGMHHGGKAIFPYFVQEQMITVPAPLAERERLPEQIKNLPHLAVERGFVAPESVSAWFSMFEKIDRGEEAGGAEIVFCHEGRQYRCRLEFTGIADAAGRPDSALISCEDITELYERERTAHLERGGLLQLARLVYPDVVSCNVTRDLCRMIQGEVDALSDQVLDGRIDEIIGMMAESVTEEYREQMREALSRAGLQRMAEEQRGLARLVYRWRKVDGSVIWMETVIMRQENPVDEDVLFILAGRDIDEEKARELQLLEQLRQQSEELSITMQQMGKYISYYDVATSTFTTSAPTTRIFPLPPVLENYPEDFLANPPEGYPAESAPILMDFFSAIRRGEPQGRCVMPSVTREGERVWLERDFVTIFDDAGRPVRAVVSSEDITDRVERDRDRELDHAGLLLVAQSAFPEILALNLSKNTYHVVQYPGTAWLGTPRSGTLEEMLLPRVEKVDPGDRAAFCDTFFAEPLRRAMEEGSGRVSLTYRRCGVDGNWHWVESVAMRQENPYDDDLLVFVATHSLDRQKEQEEQLRQALAVSSEQLEGWQYYSSLASNSFPGLIYVSYNDERPAPYRVGTMPERLDCDPRMLALATCFRIPAEDREAARLVIRRARAGSAPDFEMEYRVKSDAGEISWVNNHAIRFVDKEGDAGYIHFLTDTTAEHALTDQVRSYMQTRLSEHEKIFSITAMHADRTVCHYDLRTREARPWNREDCAACRMTYICPKNNPLTRLPENESILPDSREAAAEM
ncbi:MAG: PAS domain-containing protein, partial [Clostridia bacterium]|nr:PAS domain-containing protein [Clostridia bacterium]